MPERPLDPDREHRIALEPLADLDFPEQQASGWHPYLSNHLSFPQHAVWAGDPPLSLRRSGRQLTVLGLADEAECEDDGDAWIAWQGDELDVPLTDLRLTDPDPASKQAVGDWRSWVERGHPL